MHNSSIVLPNNSVVSRFFFFFFLILGYVMSFAAIACAEQVLKESEVEFAEAPLFSYFRGRTAYLRVRNMVLAIVLSLEC